MRLKIASAALVALASPLAAQSSTPAPATGPCDDALHRQFDFWVGKWDVRPNGKDNIVAHSLIKRLYGGCAIRENWMPLAGTGRGSLSSYDGGKHGWRQTWIDSSGTRVDFEGGYEGNAMVLTGLWRGINGPGQDGLVRMTYARQPGGRVRQLGEVSADNGAHWGPSFDFIYSPAK